MSCWSYEVKTAVYSCVHNVTSIKPRFVVKITLKLLIHIIQNWFETEKEIATLLSFISKRLPNRHFSKMAAKNSNKSKLKSYTSNRKNTFT